MGKTQRQILKMCDVDERTEWATQDTTQIDRMNNIYNCIVNLSNDVVRKDYEMTPIERQIFGYIVAMVNNIQKWI